MYRDNGKENANYCFIIGFLYGLYWGYIGIMEKKMETTAKKKACYAAALDLTTVNLTTTTPQA